MVGYLDGLPPAQAAELARVNEPGLAALQGYLALGQAVAFLGAGVSAPLYPLWDGLIKQLVDAASARLGAQEAVTLRAQARQRPGAVVEIVRQQLGNAQYQEVLREVLRVRTDAESGRSWTPVQELVCRCAFKALVTTNYDPGIVDARMRVRPGASATGFITWQDELGLDQWRTGDVFGETELPVLFAHGRHNRPDSVVLATTEYRRAYQGKLPRVLGELMITGHLVWIGFSFADQRITAILQEIAEAAGTRLSPGAAPRHVAIMAWDPAGQDNDPGTLARLADIAYGAQAVLYPAPGGDHSALALLLSALTDPRFQPAGDLPARTGPPVAAPDRKAAVGAGGVLVRWMPSAERVEHFTGRAEELARLDRWAVDPQVSLVGVTAWGGAGKTALVTHWAMEADGPARRPGVRGVFGWSFYADPSAENWADQLLKWAREELGVQVGGTDRRAAAVLGLMRAAPLLLVLDGLEVVQEGPAGAGFGRLLDGTLREVLAGACQLRHGGLVVLTSRFPFADLETFDGDRARMLEVPPFTPAEGSALLAAAGGDWLADGERRALVDAVDGHALATGVLAGFLADHPPAGDIDALRGELAAAARTDARVGRVLEFYARRLSEPDRYLLAAVSLFARPVPAAAVLKVAEHDVFAGLLAGWTPATVQAAVLERLGGLAAWHPEGTISAHPLVRNVFRPLVMDAAEAAAETALMGLGIVTSRAEILRMVEVIELLLDADQWQPADDVYEGYGGHPGAWLTLPAHRLRQRAATAFVATPARRDACAAHLGQRLHAYLVFAGTSAMDVGDLATAQQHLELAVHVTRDAGDVINLSSSLYFLSQCLGYLGEIGPARDAAAEALACARRSDSQRRIFASHAHLGWLAALVGDTAEAGRHFTAADQVVYDLEGQHMGWLAGPWWAEWLADTGRPGPARALAENNWDWDDHRAPWDRLLGRLALAAGDIAVAGDHLAAAAEGFRDGDALCELATTLADLASYAKASGDLAAAERYAAEALTIAGPRRLVGAHSAALSARAHIRAAQATATADPDLLFQGRDAADAAQRLATRHRLAWHQLDALRAHAALDQTEEIDHGWAAQAEALYAKLAPPGIDPDPLATVEQLVAAQRAAERQGRRHRPGQE